MVLLECLMTMFPSPGTSTPFSVKDILNLEQSHGVMVSSLDLSPRLDCCSVQTSTPCSSFSFSSSSSLSSYSCMLARMKQEPVRDLSAAGTGSLFGEEAAPESRTGGGPTLGFTSAFYGKPVSDVDGVKEEEKSEEKRRKGEQL